MCQNKLRQEVQRKANQNQKLKGIQKVHNKTYKFNRNNNNKKKGGEIETLHWQSKALISST